MALLGNTIKFICGSAALSFDVILICIATEQNWMVAIKRLVWESADHCIDLRMMQLKLVFII